MEPPCIVYLQGQGIGFEGVFGVGGLAGTYKDIKYVYYGPQEGYNAPSGLYGNFCIVQ